MENTPTSTLEMNNPFREFAVMFETWQAAVVGVYSENFAYNYSGYINIPGPNSKTEVQENLSSLFWELLNIEWFMMQPEQIAFQKRFDEESREMGWVD